MKDMTMKEVFDTVIDSICSVQPYDFQGKLRFTHGAQEAFRVLSGVYKWMDAQIVKPDLEDDLNEFGLVLCYLGNGEMRTMNPLDPNFENVLYWCPSPGCPVISRETSLIDGE